MKALTWLMCLLPLALYSCAKPKATVFLDKSMEEQENVKFCFTGDMGTASETQAAMAEAIKGEECDRLFLLGDLVYPKGIKSIDDEEFKTKFLDFYLPLLEENPNLIINLVLGNHDHKGKPEAWKRVGEVHERLFFPNYYYMMDYGGLCVAAFDTSFYYYLNSVSELADQTAWMQGLQSRLKDCKVKVALSHHPFKGGGIASEDDWEGSSGALKAFLDRYVIGVFDVHIAGHVHIVAYDGKDEGTTMLISGAGGEVRGKDKPGFVVLNWQPGNPRRLGYVIKHVDVTPGVFDDTQYEEAEGEAEHVINKTHVEDNVLSRFWGRMREVF